MKTTKLITGLVLLVCTVAYGQNTQQYSLGAPSGARFTTPDITWPAAHGDADVCLWEDDKLAAVCITIDDNQAYQHEKWLEMNDSLGFKFTWFVITGQVTGGGNGGSWQQFRDLYDRGHAVQSHSVAHGNNEVFQNVYGDSMLYTENWDLYYGGARDILEDSIPGNKCWTLANPGSGTNDMPTALQYHIVNRGVSSPLGNNANSINFNAVRSNTVEKCLPAYITRTAVFGFTPANYYRGACVITYHWINGDVVAGELDIIKQHEDSLWVGTFPDVMRYNMEYATHTLTQTEASDSLVSFTLTDSMADSIYTYPLTVKVRLNNNWDTCMATQDGDPIAAVLTEHDGNTYALVKAVPDGGEVVLTTTAAPVSVIRPGSVVNNGSPVHAVYYDCRGRRLNTKPSGPGIYLKETASGFVKTIMLP